MYILALLPLGGCACSLYVVFTVFSSCLSAPCVGTMQCMYCSQSSSSVAWAGQAGNLWPEPVVLI